MVFEDKELDIEDLEKEEPVDEEDLDIGEDEVLEVQEEQDEAEEDITFYKEEAQRWMDRAARLQADFTNYKRRAENEKKEYIDLGVKKLAMDFLAAVDNLERAVDACEDDNPYLAGFQMIEKQIMEILEKHGIVPMDPLDKAFDPNFHHAVLVEEKEGVEGGIVIEVLQKGYMIKDGVLRPAMVKVSQ